MLAYNWVSLRENLDKLLKLLLKILENSRFHHYLCLNNQIGTLQTVMDHHAERTTKSFKIVGFINMVTCPKFFINAFFGRPGSSPGWSSTPCCSRSYFHPFHSSLISFLSTKHTELNIITWKCHDETDILHLIFWLASRSDTSSSVNFALLPPIFI